MLTETVHTSQAGYQAVWDFVEAPSQMLENFLFEESNLKKIAVHYKKKTVLDKDTIQKIISSKNFLNNYNFLSIFVQSLYDIDLHSNKIRLESGGRNLAREFNRYVLKYMKMKRPDTSLYPASLGHLVGGYDAGYYSYMWALVYAQDIYSEFEKVINDKSAFAKASARQSKLKEVGERYRKEILEVGGSRDELVSVKKFLKRNPSNKAFLKEVGIR
jgi:Zn-dependent oligopeptidase